MATFVAIVLSSVLGVTHAQTVLQGYSSDQKLQVGMLVARLDNVNNKIVAVDSKNIDKFLGVVSNKNDSPVTISNDDNTVFVASSGLYSVLVTDEDGSIKKGDYISISSSSGIASKAHENKEFVVGVAVDNFFGSSDKITVNNRQVGFGKILVNINFGKNPNKKTSSSNIPAIFEKMSQNVADKSISSTRFYLATIIISISTIISGILLYGGVKNAIIAIGRNPLSKKPIYKGVAQVVILALIIFVLGLFGVYLVLKL